MHSAKLTTARFSSVIFVVFGFNTMAFSQENSPYSRYGLGDLAPNHSIFNRGMGGISAATFDFRSLNNTNPAALGSVPLTVFDVGGEIDVRTLKSTSPVEKFSATNTIFSSLQLGFPLTTPKMRKKNINWGMSFGLKPITKINYKIEKPGRLSNIDSIHTLYEGSGGLNQAFVGTGFSIKNLSFGVSAGYTFGNKDYSTRISLINDTVAYYMSNSSNKTTFGGILVTGGLQYQFILNKDKKAENIKVLRVGLYGNVQQKLSAKRDDVRETFNYDVNSAAYRVDSVYENKDVKGKIDYPASFGTGFTYTDNNWTFGADFEQTFWSKYKYYGQPDQVTNSWVIRVGGQYYPAKINTPIRKYFNFVKYRAGFYYGSDYIKPTNSPTRPDYAFTIGTGMPLTSLQRLSYSNPESGFVMLNTAVEIGGRGDKSTNLKENTLRISIGVSMNANWFLKRKYN